MVIDMVQNEPYPIDLILAEIDKLCGPPPVLSSESVEAYQKLQFGLFAAIQPRDTLEQLLVRHLADSTWEILRYTRHMTLLIERKHLQALEVRAQRKEKHGNEVREAVNNIELAMQQHAAEFDHAAALESGINYAKDLNHLLDAATARRDDVLTQLDRYVEFGLGGQREIGFQPIIPEVQSSKAAAPATNPVQRIL
jgi:hypothetical protein